MKTLTVMIPDLTRPGPNLQNSLKSAAQPPTLQRILSKATQKRSDKNFLTVLLCALGISGLDGSSLAEITAFYDGLPTGDGYWLRADPVLLKADLAALYMYGSPLHLLQDQIQKIKNAIQPLLEDHNMVLHTPTAERWYLQMKNPPQISSVEPNSIIGKDVMNFLPKSSGAINWQKLQTEIQMTLHQMHDINEVNSLWFWGEGKKLQPAGDVAGIKMYAEDPVSLGLAKFTGLSSAALPATIGTIINGSYNESILVFGKLLEAAVEETFFTALQELEEVFMAPLLAAVKNKKIDKLKINFLNGIEFQFTKSCCYHFWKPIRTVKI